VIADWFDLVVIGGGSAGCVIAARASENPHRRVLLIEEGSDPQPVPDIISDPARQGQVIKDPSLVRLYPVERSDGSTFSLMSGRVMGGGSAVNNLSILRPIRRDFDEWESFGGAAWSYEALLPLMRSIEDDPDFGDEPIHGRGGPVRLQRPWWPDDATNPPVGALLAAAADLGLPKCADLNVPEPLGVCASPYNLVDGRRQTVANAYLDPARHRPNLMILSGTRATRLLLDGTRIMGVDLMTADGPMTVGGDRFSLSAGAYQSPHLLMLSGIGPVETMESVGLRALHRLDGIGENFQDHAVVNLVFEGTPGLRDEHRIPKVRMIVKSDPDLPYGDLHVMFRSSISRPGGPPRMPVSIRLLDHRSRGRIWLRSADPLTLPAVDPAILCRSEDVRAVLAGIRFAEQLATHPRFAEFCGPLLSPAPMADREEHVTSTYITYNHGLGTCRMGGADDPLAVVDSELRVLGLDNLWVGDASVLPTIPHATTNLAAILVGEVVARNITA
jgi:choline dehydrogenase-like flavoprotein